MPALSLETFAFLCLAAVAGVVTDAVWSILLYRRPFQLSRTVSQKRLAALARRLDRHRRSESVRFWRGMLLAGFAFTAGGCAGTLLGWLSAMTPHGWLVVAAAVAWTADHRAVFLPGRAILYEAEHSGAIAAADILRAMGAPTTPERHAVYRTAVGLCARAFVRRLVAPVLAAALGGLPLLLAWIWLDALLRGLETDEAAQGAVRRGVERLHALVAWLPVRVAGLAIAVAAIPVPGGRPLAALAAALPARLDAGPLPATAAALGVTLGNAGRWIGTGRVRLEANDLRRAMGLFIAGAVVNSLSLGAAALVLFAAAG